MQRQKGRRAVAFVEFTVVFAILGVASGLAVTAVQAARVSAARVEAANAMRQLMLATHAYAGQHADQLLDYTGRPSRAGL